MANEFDFLRSRWPKLAALGADATRLVDFSPITALSSLRDYCEWAADIMLDMLGSPMPPDTLQADRISALQSLGTVPPDVLQKLVNIQATQERSSGNPLGDPAEARARISDAIDIGRWMLRQDGGRGYNTTSYSRDDLYATGRQSTVSYRAPAEGSYGEEEYADRYDDGYGDSGEPEANRRGPRFSFNFRDLLDRFRGNRSAIPMAIAAVLLIILLVSLILILSHCGKSAPAASTTTVTTPSETFSMLVTPSPSPTIAPTPTPTVQVKYVDEFEDSEIKVSHSDWENYYLGKWNTSSYKEAFSVFNGGSGTDAAGVDYEHGLGWFIKSSDFGSNNRRALTFPTDGKYTTLTFDMGVDYKWYFDDASDCGTYRILVFVDDATEEVWSSDWVNYNYYKTGIEVDITGAESVKIRLEQKKGSKGSLNVVLGNCGFTGAAEAVTTTPASTTTTTAATTAGTTTTTAAAE